MFDDNVTSSHPEEASIPIPCQVLPLVNTLYESFGLQPRCRRSLTLTRARSFPYKNRQVMTSDSFLFLDGISYNVRPPSYKLVYKPQ